MNVVAPKLTEWVTMWRAAIPGFEVDSLWRGAKQQWRPIFSSAIEEYQQRRGDLTFQLLGVASPGGRHVLEIDRYQHIEMEEETLEVGGEADSWALLIDRQANTEVTLSRCGTPCGYHWGAWLSRTSFALAGWQDADEFSKWKQGCLLVYSMSDSTVDVYVTGIVSAGDYSLYESAWKDWLLRRYRDLKVSGRGL